MDEDEFLQSLKTDDEKFNEFVAGAEHFVRLKQQSGYEQPAPIPTEKRATSSLGSAPGSTLVDAGLAEKRASLAEKMKSLGPLSLGLIGGGAAAGGIGTYLASRPREELGGKSKAEDELEGMVEQHQKRPEHGLLHKMKNRTTELEHGYAKAFRDHPLKAGLLGAGAGATGGYGLARLLDAVRGAAR
jgi:hypothetical protein